jgi:hypothetical protein
MKFLDQAKIYIASGNGKETKEKKRKHRGKRKENTGEKR